MRVRRVIALGVVLALIGVACSSGGGEGADPALNRDDDGASLDAPLPTMPPNPVDAAEELVKLVQGTDEAVARAATVELLCRSGLAVVDSDGPVVAVPDSVAFRDATVYAEFIPNLTESVREGDFYTLEQLAELLFRVGVTTEPVPVAELAASLGVWARDDGDDPTAASVPYAVPTSVARRPVS